VIILRFNLKSPDFIPISFWSHDQLGTRCAVNVTRKHPEARVSSSHRLYKLFESISVLRQSFACFIFSLKTYLNFIQHRTALAMWIYRLYDSHSIKSRWYVDYMVRIVHANRSRATWDASVEIERNHRFSPEFVSHERRCQWNTQYYDSWHAREVITSNQDRYFILWRDIRPFEKLLRTQSLFRGCDHKRHDMIKDTYTMIVVDRILCLVTMPRMLMAPCRSDTNFSNEIFGL